MDDAIRAALSRGGTIDITTTGRKSGLPRRIEIVFHRIDGRIGSPGMPSAAQRSWIANLEADPHLTVPPQGPGRGGRSARHGARVVEDPAERRHVLERVARRGGGRTSIGWSQRAR